MKTLKHIEYILVHLDGVLLENILGPILYSMMKSFGIPYTVEVESNILAKPLEEIGSYLRSIHGLTLSDQDLFEQYLIFRSSYEHTHSIQRQEGFIELLSLIESNHLNLLAYGGAPFEYFAKHMKGFESNFTQPMYIQTRDFRPGLLEIIDQLNIKSSQILFIDEEANVAKVAVSNQIPFIGFKKNFEYSFQTSELERLNLPYTVNQLTDINIDLLYSIDQAIDNSYNNISNQNTMAQGKNI